MAEGDIPNWFALMIELAIGGTLASIFFIRQQKQGNKLQKIIDEQHGREERWKSEWGKRIISELDQIKQLHKILETWLVDYINNKSEHTKKNIMDSAERLVGIVNFHVQNLNENIPKIENLLNDPLLATQMTKQSEYYLTSFQVLGKEYFWKGEELNGQIQAIDGKIKTITSLISRMEKEIVNLPE